MLDTGHTPWKINMEHEHAPLEKENNLPIHHFQVLSESSGAYVMEFSVCFCPSRAIFLCVWHHTACFLVVVGNSLCLVRAVEWMVVVVLFSPFTNLPSIETAARNHARHTRMRMLLAVSAAFQRHFWGNLVIRRIFLVSITLQTNIGCQKRLGSRKLVFQPSIFRGRLAVSGRVPVCPKAKALFFCVVFEVV